MDSSVLLGANSPQVVAGAALGYYRAYWSPWIIGGHVRIRIEWAATRADWDRAGMGKQAAELAPLRGEVNSAIDYLSHFTIPMDYQAAPAPICRG